MWGGEVVACEGLDQDGELCRRKGMLCRQEGVLRRQQCGSLIRTDLKS